MEEIKDFNKYLEHYDALLRLRLGSAFSYKKISLAIANKLVNFDACNNLLPQDDLTFPFLDEFEKVLSHVFKVIKDPKTKISFVDDIKPAGMAPKVTPRNFMDTTKEADFWTKKDGRKIPYSVYSETPENDINIYENKFVVYFVDKAFGFIRRIERQVVSKIKTLATLDSFNGFSLNDIHTFEDLRKFRTFFNVDGFLNLKSGKSHALLSDEESPYIVPLHRILDLRRELSHIVSTSFYKEIKRNKPLSADQIHTTNILATHPDYAPIYAYYFNLLKLVEEHDAIEKVNSININSYHNYVVMNLLHEIYRKNFHTVLTSKDVEIFFNRNGLLEIHHYRLRSNALTVEINTKDANKIELQYHLNYLDSLVDKTLLMKKKLSSKIMIEVRPNISTIDAESTALSSWANSLKNSYLKDGFVNTYIVSNVNVPEINDLVIASPYFYKENGNLESVVSSSLLFINGDNFLYSRICPICGGYVDGEQIDGNCYCANCGSTYALLRNDEDGTKKNTVWIKKFK